MTNSEAVKTITKDIRYFSGGGKKYLTEIPNVNIDDTIEAMRQGASALRIIEGMSSAVVKTMIDVGSFVNKEILLRIKQSKKAISKAKSNGWLQDEIDKANEQLKTDMFAYAALEHSILTMKQLEKKIKNESKKGMILDGDINTKQ